MAAPTLASLNSTIGGKFELHTQHNGANAHVHLLERSDTIELQSNAGGLKTVKLDAPGGTSGLWVTYVPNATAYGFAKPGHTWGASGPFSGCRLVIGKKDKQLYLAHIATPDAASAPAWRARGWQDEVWVEFKVPICEDLGGYPGSYIFVDWSKGTGAKDLKVFRMDVLVSGMGGTDGIIKRVTQLA